MTDQKTPGQEYAKWKPSDADQIDVANNSSVDGILQNLTKDQVNDLSSAGVLSWRPIKASETGTMGPLRDLLEGKFDHNDVTMQWRNEQAREILGLRKTVEKDEIGDQIEDRVLRVEPINIESTEENLGIERRKFSSKLFDFKNENNKVVEYYGGTKSREITKGVIHEISIDGESYKIIISKDPASPHMSYEPSRNVFQVGPDAIAEYKQDPEMFLSSFLHESAHKEYFSLSEAGQRALDGLIKDSPRLKPILERFATALYSDRRKMPDGQEAGQQYLDVHNKDNESTKQNTLSPDGQTGLKDTRIISFELDGQQREVFVGLLVTELISLTSSLEISGNVYDKVAERGRSARGGEDVRYDIAKMFHDQISKDDQLKQYFENMNLFRAKKPEFATKLNSLI